MVTQVRCCAFPQYPTCRYIRYQAYMGGVGMVYYDPDMYSTNILLTGRV
jgi:hypothetical protein